MTPSEINLESYNLARAKSVNHSKEQEQSRIVQYNKRDLREARREGFAVGARKGLKRGFIVGAMVTIIACSGFSMAHNFLSNQFKSISNSSVVAGATAINNETHRTDDYQNYWYDYGDIASSFDGETMDFDSFVYGNYQQIGWNQESRLSCMDDLFYQFSLRGITDCNSFLSYCDSKGLCKEVDGKLQVDTKAYEGAIKDYLLSIKESQELENDIDSFRHGK